MKGFYNSSKNGDHVRFRGKMADSEQPLQLLQAYNYGGAAHESDDRSVWKKIDEKSQPIAYMYEIKKTAFEFGGIKKNSPTYARS